MKWSLAILLYFTMVVGCSRPVTETPPDPLRIEVGSPFPNLLLPDLDGRPVSVNRWHGQKLILHIFASW
jgi:hypothetical protein